MNAFDMCLHDDWSHGDDWLVLVGPEKNSTNEKEKEIRPKISSV